MATSTLIQYLPSGELPDTSNRSQTETFIARETVAVGDWVAFDYAATDIGNITRGIFKADGNSSPVRTPFGVVIGSADRDASGTPLFTAGSRIIVCISGVAIASCSDNGGASSSSDLRCPAQPGTLAPSASRGRGFVVGGTREPWRLD